MFMVAIRRTGRLMCPALAVETARPRCRHPTLALQRSRVSEPGQARVRRQSLPNRHRIGSCLLSKLEICTTSGESEEIAAFRPALIRMDSTAGFLAVTIPNRNTIYRPPRTRDLHKNGYGARRMYEVPMITGVLISGSKLSRLFPRGLTRISHTLRAGIHQDHRSRGASCPLAPEI
jgi:hypothetical protein